MTFKLELTKDAVKHLKKQDRKIIKRLTDAINEMVEDPLYGDVVRLKGYEYFRKRVGNYRIIFNVNFSDSRVLIIDILPRGKVYKNLK